MGSGIARLLSGKVSCRYGALAAYRNLTAGIVTALALLAAAPALAEEATVAALGDSLTAGYGLPAEDGFVPELQRWLDERGAAATLLNAGVSGDTTAGGLSRLDWTLTPEVDALIVTLGGNDLLRGVDPAVSRKNLDAILSGADARGLPVLLIGVRASGNYGPDYKAAFDAIYPALAEKHGALLVPSFFEALETAPEGLETARRRYIQDDGIHPNAAGVALIVEAIGPSVLDLIDEITP